jgi:ditrans,polycis-polyprenyl diphosphate synthase
LEIYSTLGVKTISVYVFAIDNFNRANEEVGDVMNVAEKGILELSKPGYVVIPHSPMQHLEPCIDRGILDEYGVRLNIIGRTQLLPPGTQAAVNKAKELTKNNYR